MSEPPILKLENISFRHTGKPFLFNDLHFILHAHEQIGLYGPNGCGKTTFLRLITGLEKPEKGQILFHGKPITDNAILYRLRCNTGFVLQNSDDQLFLPTVLDEVAFGPLNLGMTQQEAKKRAIKTLNKLNLKMLANSPIHTLSGGEKKMVAIASVLSMHPKTLLLDEPTAFLDIESRNRIIQILNSLEMARIVVSHDKAFLEQVTSSIMHIQNGKLALLETDSHHDKDNTDIHC